VIAAKLIGCRTTAHARLIVALIGSAVLLLGVATAGAEAKQDPGE
jgi:hypothetical protein